MRGMTWFHTYKLIYLRSLSPDHHYYRHPRTYLKLAPDVAIARKDFYGLSLAEQEHARIAAHSKNALKAVLTGRSAALAHGLELLGSSETVELALPGGVSPKSKKSWPAKVVYRTGYVDPSEVTYANGCRAVTVGRAVREIVLSHGLTEGVVAIDSAVRARRIPKDKIYDFIVGHRRYHHKGLVREAVRLHHPKSGSVAETLARLALMQANAPEITSITPQASFTDGRATFYVDFLINAWLILEVDGRSKYADGAYGRSTTETLLAEREREVRLMKKGNPVVRVYWEDLFPGEDGVCPVVRVVLEALAKYPRPS